MCHPTISPLLSFLLFPCHIKSDSHLNHAKSLKHENRRDNGCLHFRLVLSSISCFPTHKILLLVVCTCVCVCVCVHRLCTFMPLYSIPIAIVCVLFVRSSLSHNKVFPFQLLSESDAFHGPV